MIKVFTKNKKGKIELTEEELDDLLKEAYDEGHTEGRRVSTYFPMQNPNKKAGD